MSYTAIVAGLLAQLRAVSGYSSDNCKERNDLVLQNGVSKAIIVQMLGTPREEFLAMGSSERLVTWAFLLENYVALADFDQGVTDLNTELDAIYTRLRQYPRLGGVSGVFVTQVTGIERPEMDIVIGGLRFAWQKISLAVQEHVSETDAE